MKRIQHLIIAAILICGGPAIAASPMEGPLKKEGFKHLTGQQIRQAFVGKKFTDDVHFANEYKADGSILAISMGKKQTNKFAITENQLCVTDNFGETCYAVWKKGNEVRLIVGDSDFSLDGFLR